MKTKLAITAMAMGIPLFAATQSAHAEDGGPFDISNFSTTLTLTTDYVFRGISFSGEDPAIQGSFDWGYNNFYAGVWGSSIDGADYSAELDYYGGYADSIGPINYDLMLIYFHFPGSDDTFNGLETDQFETWLTLSHQFEDLPGAPNLYGRYSWSPDYTLEDGTSHYFRTGVEFSLSHGFGIDGYAGHLDVEGDGATGPNGAFASPGFLDDGYSYSHWSVGLTKSLKGFDFDLRYHDTNEDAETAAFYGDDNMEERVVFSVSRTF